MAAAGRARATMTPEGRWLAFAGLTFLALGGIAGASGVAAVGALVLSLLAAAHVAAVLARHRVARIEASLEQDASSIKLWEGRAARIRH